MSLWSYLWWKRVYSNVKIQDDIEEFKIENEECMKIKISEAWTKKSNRNKKSWGINRNKKPGKRWKYKKLVW